MTYSSYSKNYTHATVLHTTLQFLQKGKFTNFWRTWQALIGTFEKANLRNR